MVWNVIFECFATWNYVVGVIEGNYIYFREDESTIRAFEWKTLEYGFVVRELLVRLSIKL